VFIPCAGLGTRIGSITKSLPKALLKIGNKAVLSYIIESYPKTTEFVVQVGYLGGLIKEYIQLAHPDLNIKVIDLDLFEGPGSSLAYGISQALPYLQGPWIFHSCDAVITRPCTVPYLTAQNWIGCSHVLGDISQYRTVLVNGTKVLAIQEKGELDPYLVFVGIFKVQDWKSFEDHCDLLTHVSDADILNCMLNSNIHFKAVGLDWHDTGNPDSFKLTQKLIAQLEDSDPYLLKDDQSVYIFNDYVIKFFSDPNTVIDMCARGKLINGTPEITESTTHFFKYVKGSGELFSKICNPHTYKEFLNTVASNWVNSEFSFEPDFIKSFYLDKTISRVNKFLTLHDDLDRISTINSTKTKPVMELINSISLKDLDICKMSTRVHGDLHNSNVIYDQITGQFTFIDWRPNFGPDLHSGDIYYDLAKIQHGLLVDHNIVSKDQFSIQYDNNNCTVDILRPHRLVECESTFRFWASSQGYSLKRIDLITSLIFLNIAVLHHDPYSKFLFMFGKLGLTKYLG